VRRERAGQSGGSVEICGKVREVGSRSSQLRFPRKQVELSCPVSGCNHIA
jgi:hypothetical protein